jgi:DNA-binding CsgD family transcriptional regulator/PAS domain-containing protein
MRGRALILETLIADLYESALLPEQIPDVLARINAALDCDGLHLVGKDEDSGGVFASVVVGERIAAAERDYLAHYHRIDPRLQIGLNSPTGVAVACHDFLDSQFVSHSEFYQDFLIPHGPRYVIGGNIHRAGGKNIHIALNHLVGRPQFSDEKRRDVASYMFHLSRWARHLFLADELRGAASSGFFALETLGQGILILDERSTALFANQAAQRLLGDVLTTRGFRASWAPGAQLKSQFKQAIWDRQARTLPLTHSVAGRPTPLVLSLLPLPRDRGIGVRMPDGMSAVTRVLDPSLPGGIGAIPSASLVVLIRTREAVQPAGPALYQRAFGLTPAEARLADALAQGASPQGYAGTHGLSVATVRTQIRALLAKTGASSLRALVVLLASLPRTAP